MKKIITIIAVATLCACGGKDAPYKNALPKDAAAVVAVNPAQLSEKFNIKNFRETNLAKGMLGDNDLESEQKELIAGLLENPEQSGVSASDKIYAFVTTEKHGGLVARVEDRAKIDETLTKMNITKSDINGRSFVGTMDDEDTGVMAYDDNVLICYIADKPFAEMQAVIEGLFTQTEGFLGTNKEVAAALEGSADICGVVAYDNILSLAKAINPMMAMASAQMNGFEEMYKGLYMGIAANFEKGQVVTDLVAIYTDKAVQKKMEELTTKMTGNINGNVLKFIPEDAVLAFAANIKGAGIYDFMAQQEEFKDELARVPVIKEVMSAIEGDMAFALTAVKEKGIPEGAVFIELSKPETITAYASMAASLGAKPVEGKENQFVFGTDGIVVHFGVDGKLFYATNDARVAAALEGEKIASLAGNSLFKGAGAGFVNFVPLQSVLGRSDEELKQFLGAFASLEITQPGKDSNRIVLKMTDQSTNAAEVIFGLVDMAFEDDSVVDAEPAEVEEVEVVEAA